MQMFVLAMKSHLSTMNKVNFKKLIKEVSNKKHN